MTEPKRHRAITRLYTPMLVIIFLRVQGLIHPKPVSGVQLVKRRKIANGAIVALE